MSSRASSDLDRVIGTRIRLRRSALRLSQEKLAELIGVTFQQIQKYEKGANRVSAATLFRIAQELRVPASDLMPPVDEAETSAGMLDDPTVHMLAQIAAGMNAEGKSLLVGLARELAMSAALKRTK